MEMTHASSSVRTFGICITPEGLVGMRNTCPICGAFWNGVNLQDKHMDNAHMVLTPKPTYFILR